MSRGRRNRTIKAPVLADYSRGLPRRGRELPLSPSFIIRPVGNALPPLITLQTISSEKELRAHALLFSGPGLFSYTSPARLFSLLALARGSRPIPPAAASFCSRPRELLLLLMPLARAPRLNFSSHESGQRAGRLCSGLLLLGV